MRHFYITTPRRIEVFEEPVPSPGPGQVLVKIAYTTISPGSNLFTFQRGSYAGSAAAKPQEVLYMGAGTVAAVGEGVSRWSPGDRVVMATGHQEYLLAPEGSLNRVPEGLSLKEAAVSYLAAWSVSALHLGHYSAGENVVVVGQGLVGASAALVADAMGARVVALDVNPARLEFARRLEHGAVLSPAETEAVRAALGAEGADVILETSGSWHGFRTAVEIARDYSRLCIMGIYRDPPPAELGLELHQMLYTFPSKFHYQRLQIIGCGSDPDDVPQAAPVRHTRRRNWAWTLERAARGKLRLDRLITDVLPPEAVQSAFERMTGGDASMVGVVFAWP